MKKISLIIVLAITSLVYFSSCRKCTSCKVTQHQVNAPEDEVVTYDKCGDKEEIDAFKKNVEEMTNKSYRITGDTATYICTDN